ncbi:unnamed protein product [Protopolystoma xenopodis]|uniref:Uncharacterized protein n=1 Tax=Protopolystoma xenopodis TaxID=117903 RepID=A0A3S5C9E3_9PLAT|nr:unnamed protein product [Protopolystoma xenopodis]
MRVLGRIGDHSGHFNGSPCTLSHAGHTPLAGDALATHTPVVHFFCKAVLSVGLLKITCRSARTCPPHTCTSAHAQVLTRRRMCVSKCAQTQCALWPCAQTVPSLCTFVSASWLERRR